jgi:hypothetical protein
MVTAIRQLKSSAGIIIDASITNKLICRRMEPKTTNAKMAINDQPSRENAT